MTHAIRPAEGGTRERSMKHDHDHERQSHSALTAGMSHAPVSARTYAQAALAGAAYDGVSLAGWRK